MDGQSSGKGQGKPALIALKKCMGWRVVPCLPFTR